VIFIFKKYHARFIGMWVYYGLLKKSAGQFLIYSLMSFLALPQKERKRASPFKPIHPLKPKFPAIAQALKFSHFGFPLSAGPENGQATAPFR
jgi:hypothetical protein